MFLCYDAQDVMIFVLTLKRSAFERRHIIILSTLKQRQKLMLKQLHFALTLKPILFLRYTNRLSMSNKRQQVNIDEFSRHFDVLSCCNFDGRIIDVSLMYFFRYNFDG